MPKLLIGTSNQGKVDEIRVLLADLEIKLISLKDVAIDLNVDEVGETYAENAALKAKAYAQASGLVTLADDSGLEVAALGGAPGLYSARYSSRSNATDADRRDFLLKNLAGYPRPWSARFVCVVVLAAPEGKCHFYEGICPGEIIPEERGQFGFGYDPIFLVENSKQTMAELPMEEKNKLSHRARAILGAKDTLVDLLTK